MNTISSLCLDFRQVLSSRLIVCVLITLVLLSGCKKEKGPVVQEVPVEKTATYQIFAAMDYNGTPVENTNAELRLQLRTINYRTGEQKLVWDSLLPVRRIADFPLYDQKLIVIKSFPVFDSHQKLNASYSVVYRDGQIISQEGESDEAGPGTSSILLEVGL
jgi:hypothetical protein